MAANTLNMSLIKWNEGTDPYDHTQLSGNFQIIDEHDHTAGRGVRLKGASLENEAINTAQLKNASVTNAKLAGGITADKLASGIINSLGDLKFWWRSNPATAIPSGGWVIAAGQTLLGSEHEFAGGGSITLPNLINRFVRGSEIEGIGLTGGASTINLNHSHNVAAHEHSVNPHAHTINLESGFGAATNLKVSQDFAGSAWVHSDNANNQQHRHSINGLVNATGITTNAATSTTDANLSAAQTIIPPYVGLLPLIKVKNS